ncbi:transcriptional regulator BetI [Cedecea neteri]|uniref:Transcriptional regulator BetI n=1 Tax=Cedecea neteri TaxID=158822 RepID=A0A2X3JCR0_9ENTR|nr:transcriptional regulator BetI [Cedecea neteri]
MPKKGMQPIRRRQLIDATLSAINEVGMHDATVAQIARRAGVSTGIISPLLPGQERPAGSHHA